MHSTVVDREHGRHCVGSCANDTLKKRIEGFGNSPMSRYRTGYKKDYGLKTPPGEDESLFGSFFDVLNTGLEIAMTAFEYESVGMSDEDSPGCYRIIAPSVNVTKGPLDVVSLVDTVGGNRLVHAVEMVRTDYNLVRARIINPGGLGGWITIADYQTGLRYAEKDIDPFEDKALAAVPSTQRSRERQTFEIPEPEKESTDATSPVSTTADDDADSPVTSISAEESEDVGDVAEEWTEFQSRVPAEDEASLFAPCQADVESGGLPELISEGDTRPDDMLQSSRWVSLIGEDVERSPRAEQFSSRVGVGFRPCAVVAPSPPQLPCTPLEVVPEDAIFDDDDITHGCGKVGLASFPDLFEATTPAASHPEECASEHVQQGTFTPSSSSSSSSRVAIAPFDDHASAKVPVKWVRPAELPRGLSIFDPLSVKNNDFLDALNGELAQ